MLSPVHLVVKIFGVVYLETVLHVFTEVDPIEVVVPYATIRRYHKKAKELIWKNYLGTFIVRLHEPFWILSAFFLICCRPFKAFWSEPVNWKGARSLYKATSRYHSRLSAPSLVIVQQSSMHCGVDGRELASLRRLGVNPAQRFHFLQVRMIWKVMGQRAALVSAYLRD